MIINRHNSQNQPIWLLIDSRKSGGIESHIFQLAAGLHHHSLVTVVFLTHYGHHPLRDLLHKYAIETLCLDGKFTTLCKEIHKARPLLIHTHGYKAGILGRLTARLYHVPVVSTFHAGETSTGILSFYCWLDRLSARMANMVLAVSPQIAAHLPPGTRVMNNFIDMQHLQLSNSEHIAFVGRLSKEKGPDYYLLLARQFAQIDFHIYGDGPMAAELKKIAPTNINFHGQQDQMQAIWPDIGLLIMPSRYEGLPMAALEAMARGIPVLASNVGALNKLIDHGINGWLLPPGDNNALANALQNWLNMSRTQKISIKKAAQKKIMQNFSTDVAIAQLITCYRQIAS